MRMYFVIALLIVATIAGARVDAQDRAIMITRSEYGKAWPFTVDKGQLRCEGAGMVVFRSGKTKYAVNGLAQSRYARIEPIWRVDKNPVYKNAAFKIRVNIGPIIKRGLRFCKK